MMDKVSTVRDGSTVEENLVFTCPALRKVESHEIFGMYDFAELERVGGFFSELGSYRLRCGPASNMLYYSYNYSTQNEALLYLQV